MTTKKDINDDSIHRLTRYCNAITHTATRRDITSPLQIPALDPSPPPKDRSLTLLQSRWNRREDNGTRDIPKSYLVSLCVTHLISNNRSNITIRREVLYYNI